MTIADQIKSTLSMRDVATIYGYPPNRAGFISCPFHSGDDTPSLKIYDQPGRGFNCYGCGAGGSVIDFAMQLFGISFPQAVVRLNADFGLGLTNERPNDAEIDRLRRKRQQEEAELDAFRKEYMERTALFRELWFARRDLAPKSPEEPLRPLFVRSLNELDYLEYWFEENPWR